MLNERKLTKSELAKREDIIMKMKKNKRQLVKKYGKDAEAVMYGRATKLAKKQAESMDQDKIKELVKDALQNPKKADLNKDGKLSDYEKKRGATIEKSMSVDEVVLLKDRPFDYQKDYIAQDRFGYDFNELEPEEQDEVLSMIGDLEDEQIANEDINEDQGFGSSDMSALLSSMHINLRYPKEFPGLSQIMDAAEDATDVYMNHLPEYKTNREGLIMSNARAYARREFPDFMAQAAKFIEPIDEMDSNDPKDYRVGYEDKIPKSELKMLAQVTKLAKKHGFEVIKNPEKWIKKNAYESGIVTVALFLHPDRKFDVGYVQVYHEEGKPEYLDIHFYAWGSSGNDSIDSWTTDEYWKTYFSDESYTDEKLDEMDRNDPIATRLRADKMKREKDAAKSKRRPLYGKQRQKVEDALLYIDQELEGLYSDKNQTLIDMEQEAEPEGGPIADRYGNELNKIENQIQSLIAKKDKLEARLDETKSINEENISLDEVGYNDGEQAVAMHFNQDVVGINNESDFKQYKKGFIQGVKDELGSYLSEDLREISGDKMEALMELRNILDELQVLGDQAREIIAMNFPSYLNQGEAYGAFDMGSSSNRYDTTLASIVSDIEEYGEDEDLNEDLDLGHQDNEPHMLKSDLYRIGKYAMELYQILDQFEAGSEEVDLPHWWQSKIIKSKDAIVGAKHYLDFEIKEPQIDAMVDVAQDVEAINEFDDESMKAYGDAVKKVYMPKQAKLSSAEYQKAKKSKDFNKDDYKWNPDESLYVKLNEGVWSLGSAKSIKNIIGILDMALDIKDPQELMDLMDMHDKSMYNIVGDDVFHDDIDGAKRELAQNNLDRAYNRLIDAKGRAEDLLKIASENDLKNPSIFEGIAKKLAKQLKSK